jgi:hypothetical protein
MNKPVKIMNLPTEPYLLQRQRWPQSGRHILAHFDSESIVVYQAYRPTIGRYAAEYQRFGGEFNFARMSWIKTNFLWMMYRSGWCTKPDQEVTLAIRIRHAGFDQLLLVALGGAGLTLQGVWNARLRASTTSSVLTSIISVLVTLLALALVWASGATERGALPALAPHDEHGVQP